MEEWVTPQGGSGNPLVKAPSLLNHENHINEGGSMKSLKRHFGTILVAMVTAMVTAAAPSIAHVTSSWLHLRDKHVKPFADGRYPKKADLKTADAAINETADPVHWSNLNGVPADLADGTDADSGAALAAELQTDDGTVNESGDPVHWTNLNGVPVELLDGDAAGGTPLTRWGTQSAPAGTTLLYSGVAFESHHTHPGSETACLKSGDPGATATYQGDILYPVETGGTTPPGITAGRLMHCAVFLPPGPAVVVWGAWTGPVGWTQAYKGFGMGGHYTHAGTNSRGCVDTDAFDASVSYSTTAAIWYQSSIQVAPTANYTATSMLKCSVWMQT
jgi:hypothetical protein